MLYNWAGVLVLLAASLSAQPLSVEDGGLSIVVTNAAGRQVWFKAALRDRENIMVWTQWIHFQFPRPVPIIEIVPHNDTATFTDWPLTYNNGGGWAMEEPAALTESLFPPDAIFSIRAWKFVILKPKPLTWWQIHVRRKRRQRQTK